MRYILDYSHTFYHTEFLKISQMILFLEMSTAQPPANLPQDLGVTPSSTDSVPRIATLTKDLSRSPFEKSHHEVYSFVFRSPRLLAL